MKKALVTLLAAASLAERLKGCFRDASAVAVAYVVGFFILLAMLGWHPQPRARERAPAAVPQAITLPASTAAADSPFGVSRKEP